MTFSPASSPSSARRSRPRSVLRALAAVCCLLPLAACGGTSVPPPHPTGAAAKDCRALYRLLPKTLHGLRREQLSPASDYTAAWGSPAIVLRCGVPRPLMLDPSHPKTYDPNVESADLGGVNWLPESVHTSDVRMTTTNRQAYVEVTIPAHYVGKADSTAGLTQLAAAIRKTVPAEVD